MEVIKTNIEGVVIIEPRIFRDERGYFFESFSQRDFQEKVCKTVFVQDNESKSSYGVLRGLHFQKPPYAQSKLVRVIKGAVLDVAVDIRKGSPTFGQHVAVELTEDNHRQFFIPRGFAHGFSVLTDEVISNTNVTISMPCSRKVHWPGMIPIWESTGGFRPTRSFFRRKIAITAVCAMRSGFLITTKNSIRR